MKKKILFPIAMFASALALTSCADAMPDLTEEQQDIIAEYSAQQLLKYCSYYDDGLDQEAMTDEETETETEDQSVEDAPEDTQTDGGTTEETETMEAQTESVQTLNLDQVDLAELLQQDEFEITYDKYEIDTSYPQDANASFSLDAPTGKEFLVLFFSAENMSSEEATFDILNTDIKFKMNLNDLGYKSNLSTLLMDDLSTCEDQFTGNETKEYVLILQMNESDVTDAETLILEIESGDNTTQIKLF